MKRIFARFYRTETGVEPVRDWLAKMSSTDRKIIGTDIASVELGWHAGAAAVRRAGGEVFEVRSEIRDETADALTYFAVEDDLMILLHGHEITGPCEHELFSAFDRLADHRERTRAAMNEGNFRA